MTEPDGPRPGQVAKLLLAMTLIAVLLVVPPLWWAGR